MEVDPLLRQAFAVPALQPDWEAALLKSLGYAPTAPAEPAPPPADAAPLAAAARAKARPVLGVRWA